MPFVPTDGGLQVNTKLRQGVAALAAWAGGDWLRQELAAGFAEADTTYGKIGVKVWIYKGEVLKGAKPAPRKEGGNK